MLILFFLLLIFVVIIYSNLETREKKLLIIVLLVVLFWNLFWLLLVQTELANKGVYTYGSDAEYYYTQIINAIHSARPFYTAIHSRLAPLYVFFGVLVLKTSPNLSSIWIKIANIVLIELCFIIIYFWLRNYVYRKTIVLDLVLIFGLNGIITWTVLRELKDTLFVFFVLLNLYMLYYLLKRGKSLVAVIFTGIMSLLMYHLRMFAAAIPLGLLLAYILIYRKSIKKDLFLWFGAFLLLIVILERDRIHWFYTGLIYYAGRFREPLSILTGNYFAQIVLSPFRFIIGPGPIRALAGSDLFVLTTNMGNVLIFLGALLWWVFLPILLMAFIFDFKFILENIYFFASPIFIVLMYSFMYLGTGDTRLRATVYLLFLPGLIKYLDYIKLRKSNSKILSEYVLSSFIVWSLGLFFSVITV